MCGIALVLGPGADRALFRRMLSTLAPRGEVEEVLLAEGLLAGTRRLRIVDREKAVQPWTSADGSWLLCYNGEIFNHGDLRTELTSRGRTFRSDSDTEVVLEAFLQWGSDAVKHLRGEYAFVIVERLSGRAYVARDPLGVKPLYWSRRDGRLHLASEVKALVPVGAPVHEVGPGQHGWAYAGTGPDLMTHVDMARLGDDLPPVDDPDEAVKLVRMALQDSIRVRLDTDLTVGVVLSGGLDSSLVLRHVAELHPDCVAITVGAPDSPDLAYATRLCADLGVAHEIVPLRPKDIRLPRIREAVRLGELTEYGDIINAVVSIPLFRRVRDLGVKVVLTGDGSDELFGGYPMYHEVPPTEARRLFLHKIQNLYRTELQRVDRASMGHGVEARIPFLDPAVVEVAMRIPLALKLRNGREKWIVREAFADMLPRYVYERPKNPMSWSTGLHDRARLYRPLFAKLHREFGYGVREPVRRDFDSVLRRCAHNLDRALADSATRQDYHWYEHTKDFLGALRWNLRRPAPKPQDQPQFP